MGAGASAPFESEEAALKAGKTQDEIDAWKTDNAPAPADAPATSSDTHTNMAELWFSHCAVTGGNGFLGTHIVQQLLASGVSVVTTVRSPTEKKVAHLMALPGAKDRLKICDADLLASDKATFSQAFSGCQVLLHVASPFFYNAKDGQKELVDPALEGTKKVLDAAKDAKVGFVVVTSSSASVSIGVKPSNSEKGFSSADWSDIEKLRGWNAWYPLSKTLAEKAAWARAEKLGLPLCTICPCQIFGPLLQPGINTSSRKILDLLNGKPKKLPNTNMTYVDVRDVAKLHIAAAQTKAKGRRIMAVAGAIHHRETCTILKAVIPHANVPMLVEGDADDGSVLATAPVSLPWDTSDALKLGVVFRTAKDTFEATAKALPVTET